MFSTKYKVAFLKKLLSLFSIIIISCSPIHYYLESAKINLNLKRYEQGIKFARILTKKYPLNAEGWLLLSQYYGALGKIDSMYFALDTLLSIYPSYKFQAEKIKKKYQKR